MVEIGGRPILWHIMKHYAALRLRRVRASRSATRATSSSDTSSTTARSARDLTRRPGRRRRSTSHDGDAARTGRCTWSTPGCDTETGGRAASGSRRWLDDETVHADLRRRRGRRRPRGAARASTAAHGKLATVTAVRPPARFGGLAFDGDARRASSPRSRRSARAGSTAASCVLEPEVLRLHRRRRRRASSASRSSGSPRTASCAPSRTRGSGSAWTRCASLRTLGPLSDRGNAPWVTW